MHHDAQAATCTEAGWNAYDTCTRCDYTTYQAIQALGHDLVHHDAQAATCTEIGWNAYDTCKRCDYTTYVEIPAQGHTWDNGVITDPTCTAQGYTTHTCSVCQYSYKDDYKDPLGHDYSIITTSEGKTTYKCSRCHDFFEVEAELPQDVVISEQVAIDETSSVALAAEEEAKEAARSTQVEEFASVAVADVVATVKEDYATELANAKTEIAAEVGGNDAVKIQVQVKMDVVPISHNAATKSLKLELTPKKKVIAVSEVDQTKTRTLTDGWEPIGAKKKMSAPITITIDISGLGFLPERVKATHSDGTVEYPNLTIAGNIASFSINRFSTFELLGAVPTPAPAPSSSGGSATVSTVGATEAKNGTVSASANNATAGSTVTINVKPDAGYKVSTVKVVTKSGKEVEVKETDGTYTFVMPSEEVEISAEFVEAEAEQVFADVPTTAYYADAVEWAVEKGITTGTTETTFSPNNSCTRAQMVTFLWRAAGSPKTDISTAFTDVDGDEYYAQAIAWALDNRITNGKGKGLFDPNGTITRAESITLLYRFAKGAAGANVRSGFTDVDAYAYYFNAVDWAVNNGITNGTTETTFSPNADCVRAQIVTFLYRLLAEK